MTTRSGVLFLYGSQTGAAKSICEGLFSQAQSGQAGSGIEALRTARIAPLNDYAAIGFESALACIIVCSTTGDGDAPNNADAFLRYVRKRTLPKDLYSGLHVAVLGLGDTNYDKFCNCSKQIVKRLSELGTSPLVPPAYADEAVGLESVVDPWSSKLWPALRSFLVNEGQHAEALLHHQQQQQQHQQSNTTSTTLVSSSLPTDAVDSAALLPRPSSPSMLKISTPQLQQQQQQQQQQHHDQHVLVPPANPSDPFAFIAQQRAIESERRDAREKGDDMRKMTVEIVDSSSSSTTTISSSSTVGLVDSNNDLVLLHTYPHLAPSISQAQHQHQPGDAVHASNSASKGRRSRASSSAGQQQNGTINNSNDSVIALHTAGRNQDEVLELAARVAASIAQADETARLEAVAAEKELAAAQSGFGTASSSSSSSSSIHYSPQTTVTDGVRSLADLYPSLVVPSIEESLKSRPIPSIPQSIVAVKVLSQTAILTSALSSSLSSSSSSLSTSGRGDDFDLIVLGERGVSNSNSNNQENRKNSITGGGSATNLTPHLGRSSDAPLAAAVTGARYLTKGDRKSDRRVIHMDISVKGSPLEGSWQPGDSISILAPNSTPLCLGLCERLGISPYARLDITEPEGKGPTGGGGVGASSSLPLSAAPSTPLSPSSTTTENTTMNGLANSGGLILLSPSASPKSQTSARCPIHLPSWLSGFPYPTALDLFLWCFDLTSTPKKSLLRLLGEHCVVDDTASNRYDALLEKKTLLFLASGAGKAHFSRFIEEQRLTLLDLLILFPSSRVPLSSLISVLTPLPPRSYSITCSPFASRSTISVAFSAVEYECSSLTGAQEDKDKPKIKRVGLATSYMEDILCAPYLNTPFSSSSFSSTSSVSFSPPPPPLVRIILRPARDFLPPVSLQSPLIMIGPGTGVAPFIGFLQHRAWRAEKLRSEALAVCRGQWRPGCHVQIYDTGAQISPLGASHLFFGNRQSTVDFLFENELDAFLTSGSLTELHTAWSREPGSAKVYVQQRIVEKASLIADLVLRKGAHIYVCGDGMRMAKDVHAALTEALVLGSSSWTEGKIESLHDAEAKLQSLTKEAKYSKDVWS